MSEFQYESFSDFLKGLYNCSYIIDSKSALHNYIKKISDNFDPFALNLFIEETRDFIYSFESYFNTEEEAYFKSKEYIGSWFSGESNVVEYAYVQKPINLLSFDSSMTLSERIDFVEKNNITIINNDGFENILRFSIFLEDIYNYVVKKRILNDKSYASPNPQPLLEATTIPVLKLNTPLNDACLLAILEELITMNFIVRSKTVKDDWLFWFGRNEDLQNPRKIHWYTKHSILPNVIKHICGSWTLEAIKNAFFAKKFISNKNEDYIGKPLYTRIENIKKQFV